MAIDYKAIDDEDFCDLFYDQFQINTSQQLIGIDWYGLNFLIFIQFAFM